VSRFVCLHGHFYQPPRENAWLGEIEAQWSAAPYHDWNERVAAECYTPNTAARILGAGERVVDIVNNYASISFDAGPTLLSWLEKAAPETYRAILEADQAARARFRGHGGAMAQCYNHLIMPLATSRDKRTQVVWGVRDFESRFGRRPEGMWLPETAVDLESLDVMAEFGVKFTVLAPRQAEAVLDPTAGGEWREVENGGVDPRRPYLCRLPSGRTIALFFYDGAIAHDLAFGGLLRSGEDFARRLAGAFSGEAARPELVHVATDGESYGHHHRFGEMALAYALRHIERNGLAEITVYGDYLARFPPTVEARVRENTSWSCAHGLGRWQCGCACNSGAHEGWSQEWRAPLREAMTWLGERAAGIFETGFRAFAPDPWAVRDDYIRIVRDSSLKNVDLFLREHAGRQLGPDEKAKALDLLELGRHAMLIFTSDAWFFDDISNIETVQNLQYAARAMELARDAGGPDLEPEFVRMLEPAKSNLRRHKNGAVVFETLVRPAKPDVLHPCGRRAGAHVRERGAELDTPAMLLGRGVAALVEAWAEKPEDAAALERIEAVLSGLKGAGLEPDLWQSQNVFFATGKALSASAANGAGQGPTSDASWLKSFKAVGELLGFSPTAISPAK
jgi:alpha-amylase/alpha-mannosidase (GH57 family)